MRRRISWLVVATTSTIVVSFVIPLCLLVRTLAEEKAMAAADQEAHNIAILVTSLGSDANLAESVARLDDRGTPTTVVLTPDGTWLGSDRPVQMDAELTRGLVDAFTVTDSRGGRVYLPVVAENGTWVVRSSVTAADLHSGVARAWIAIVGLGLLLQLLALRVASALGRRISEPLREVASVAHQLREGDLTARADISGTEETEELARALNGLAERTEELLVAERAAVADLSHRLRTPVTALRLDAEAVTEPELADRLQEHIASLQRTIDAIVKEARRPVRTDFAPVSDAVEIVGRRLAFWSALADDQGRQLGIDLPAGRLPVAVAGDDLADVVDVLVDNVFAHTPEGTGFRVSLNEIVGQVCLVVLDDGAGLPAEGRTERRGSTGLGLDIARRTASAAGGRLTLESPPEGGTRVEVWLALATAVEI